MEIKKKWVYVGLLLLVLAWVGNIFYYNKHVLKETVFLKHYYDLPASSRIELFYIQNINNKDEIINIEFPELGNGPVRFNESYKNSDHRYYNLKSVIINLNVNNTTEVPEELKDKLITKAIVYFSRGKTLEVNLGKIYINRGIFYDRPSLTSLNSSSSSDGTGGTTFAADKNLKVIKVESSFPELLDNGLEVYINNQALKSVKLPLELKAGETLNVSRAFNFDIRDVRSYFAYDFAVNILTEDSDGNKGYGSVFVNYWLQFPEQFNVDKLVNVERRK
jgi:hypothetical protein